MIFKPSPAIILFLALLFPSVTRAQQNSTAINQQDWITRNQQDRLEEEKRKKEKETIEKEHERKQEVEEEKKENPPQPKIKTRSLTCAPVKKITEIKLINAGSIPYEEQEKLLRPFIGKPLNQKTLSQIVAAINNYYQSQGRLTTKVMVPKQSLQKGVFEIKIIEGKIEKVTMGEDRLTDKMQVFTAFGSAEGRKLDLDEINQGMYQINRLKSNSATMKIEPGEVAGNNKIIITNNRKFPAQFSVGKDNLGNKFTGVQRTNFSANLDNLLFLNDNLKLGYITNTNDDSQDKDLKSFTAGISIPYKFNSFFYDYSHSEFKGPSAGNSGTTTTTGFSEQQKFLIDRVFLNQINLRIAANASLTTKKSASYSDGEKIDSSERRLSVMNIGLTTSYYFNDDTSLYLKPSYSQGLGILNAMKDAANSTADTPKAQFELFKLYATFSKKFTLPKTTTPAKFTIDMDSQIAQDTLFGSEKFAVGGYYSVRGFRETFITGDKGYYFRNKINFNLGSLVLPLLPTEKPGAEQNFFSKNLYHLNKFQIEPFYDYGYVKNNFSGGAGRLSGGGMKTIFESKYFTASLTYAKAINKSKLTTSAEKENEIIYFELSASCC